MTEILHMRYERFIQDFEAIVERGQPVVAEIGDDFGCRGWTLNYLRDLIGDHRVKLHYSEERFRVGRNEEEYQIFTFSAYFDMLDSSENFFVMAATPVQDFPELASGIEVPKPLERIERTLISNLIWIYDRMNVASLHFDQAENLNLQICGSKTFHLFPPRLDGFLPNPALGGNGHHSQLNRFEDAPTTPGANIDLSTRHVVTLTAGQMLYLPFCWWHQVESGNELAINVNFWWRPTIRKSVRHPGQMWRAIATFAWRAIHRPELLKG